MTSVLSIRNLRFSRGHGFRLDLPSLDVRPGERVLLAGPSGCGKSTLLWLVAGLLQAEAGEILVAGDRIDAMRESDRDRVRARRIGLVFQTHQLLPAFTAEENVSLALLAADEPERLHASRARELLAALGVNRPDAPIAELSVGQQQRVAVARAVACRPALVLADEPTASLDPDHAGATMKLLEDACRNTGAALLCASHDPAMQARFERVVPVASLVTRRDAA
jgi:ABC-type lipoprotein export system ATPase subunit